MPINFNIDEVLEMAEEIEVNGEKFYLQAERLVPDRKMKSIFKELAVKESKHRNFFASLRQSLTQKEKEAIVFDPEGQTESYLKAMADSHVFSGSTNPEKLFSGTEPVGEVIKIALSFEKDSILFFIGLKEFLPQESGKEKIDLIVREEMQHISELRKML